MDRTFIREFNRIADEVEQHLPYTGLPQGQTRHAFGRAASQSYTLLRRTERKDGLQLRDKTNWINGAVQHIHALGLQLREVQHIVDEGDQRARRELNAIKVFTARSGVQPRVIQKFRKTNHGIERRPNLMAHRRQEVRLRPRGGPRRRQRPHQTNISKNSCGRQQNNRDDKRTYILPGFGLLGGAMALHGKRCPFCENRRHGTGKISVARDVMQGQNLLLPGKMLPGDPSDEIRIQFVENRGGTVTGLGQIRSTRIHRHVEWQCRKGNIRLVLDEIPRGGSQRRIQRSVVERALQLGNRLIDLD